MMHPILNSGVELGTFIYEDTGEEGFLLSDRRGEEYEISYELFRELMRADGSSVLRLPKDTIRELKEEGILATSRLVKDGWLNRYILFILGKRAKRFRPVCRRINAMLPYGAVLVFFLGIAAKLCIRTETESHLILSLYYGMLIASMAAHEWGHITAALAFGCTVTDMGLLLLGIIPAGAYTAYQEMGELKQGEKIQLSLAGIEMNLMLAGLFLLASVFCPDSYTWMMAANVNVFLVLFNILPVEGLDGEWVLSDLLGVKSVGALAWRSLTVRRKGERFLRSGPIGWLCLAFCGLLCLFKLAVAALIAFNGLYGLWIILKLIGLLFF